jgi:limonene-1,2-epoxide hydrolase
MDWDDLAQKIEAAEDGRTDDSVIKWKALFAPGGTYQDPVNPPTSDLDAIAAQTQQVLPDWHITVTRIFGDQHQVAVEWVGEGTLMGQMPMQLHGTGVIQLDQVGRIVTWRDYFDQKEIEDQLTAQR